MLDVTVMISCTRADKNDNTFRLQILNHGFVYDKFWLTLGIQLFFQHLFSCKYKFLF